VVITTGVQTLFTSFRVIDSRLVFGFEICCPAFLFGAGGGGALLALYIHCQAWHRLFFDQRLKRT